MNNYEKFLKIFDKELSAIFEAQSKYIKCKKGCSYCCEKGDYPMSQLEFSYLTRGFIGLPNEIKSTVQKNINEIKKIYFANFTQEKEHRCPFLIDKECCVYEYRPLICRTYGVCYYDDERRYVRLPDCVNFGLNYSEQYDSGEKLLNIQEVEQRNLRIDKILISEPAKELGLDAGEIRPMMSWLDSDYRTDTE